MANVFPPDLTMLSILLPDEHLMVNDHHKDTMQLILHGSPSDVHLCCWTGCSLPRELCTAFADVVN